MAVAVTRFWLIPNADTFRPRIVSELSRLSGQRVVIEPWHIDNPASAPASAPASVVQPVYFSWDAAPLAVAAGWQPGAAAGSRLQAALVCPMRDFALALKMAAQALGRLAWGIAGLGEFLIAGRGRVQPCMESNPP